MAALSKVIVAASDGVRERPRWLVLSLAGAAFVLIWGLPTIVIPLATDQVLFSLGARTVLHGQALYTDLWDIKPPLIYFIYTVPFALVGEHMEAVRVLDLVNTFLAMTGIFLLSRRLFSERAAIISAAFYGFAYLTWATVDGLGEVESFMAAPLAFALFVYVPEDGHRTEAPRAALAGLLLGAVFALKTAGVLFVLGLPAAELLLRPEGRWTPAGAARRLGMAAAGFLVVQLALLLYLAAMGALSDFIDIQRHYTLPYNRYRFTGAEGSELRFLLAGTSDWIKDNTFIVVPAAVALFFGFFRREHARALGLLAFLALVAVAMVWWQGKMFRYHWLIMLPVLALLAGYAADQAVGLFAKLPQREQRAANALLALALIVFAYPPLIATYDNYRTLVSYADGTLDRRDVEARYLPLYRTNHQLVDYIRANGGPDDRVFIWGFWPIDFFWLDRPLVDRFVFNSGLRATWAPDSWRRELIDDLTAAPPRFFVVARGDNQPWLSGTTQTSDEHLRDSFPEIQRFLEQGYAPVQDMGLFVLYERNPAAVQRPPR